CWFMRSVLCPSLRGQTLLERLDGGNKRFAQGTFLQRQGHGQFDLVPGSASVGQERFAIVGRRSQIILAAEVGELTFYGLHHPPRLVRQKGELQSETLGLSEDDHLELYDFAIVFTAD